MTSSDWQVPGRRAWRRRNVSTMTFWRRCLMSCCSCTIARILFLSRWCYTQVRSEQTMGQRVMGHGSADWWITWVTGHKIWCQLWARCMRRSGTRRLLLQLIAVSVTTGKVDDDDDDDGSYYDDDNVIDDKQLVTMLLFLELDGRLNWLTDTIWQCIKYLPIASRSAKKHEALIFNVIFTLYSFYRIIFNVGSFCNKAHCSFHYTLLIAMLMKRLGDIASTSVALRYDRLSNKIVHLSLRSCELLLDASEFRDESVPVPPSRHLRTDSQLCSRVFSDLDPVRRGIGQRRHRRHSQRVPVKQILTLTIHHQLYSLSRVGLMAQLATRLKWNTCGSEHRHLFWQSHNTGQD